MSGDDQLCGFERRLWGLVNHVLLRWNTLVIFRWDQYSVPDRKDGYITFFVPVDCTFRYEIVKFLEHELETEQREASDLGFPDGSGYRPAVHVEVEVFSGLQPYLERDVAEKIAKEFVTNFIQKMSKDKK